MVVDCGCFRQVIVLWIWRSNGGNGSGDGGCGVNGKIYLLFLVVTLPIESPFTFLLCSS